MKKLLIPLMVLTFNLTYAQMDMGKDYDQAFIINTEIDGVSLQYDRGGDPYVNPEKLSGVQSPDDLKSILSETSFIILTLKKPGAKFEKESQDISAPMITLNNRLDRGQDIRGFGNFLVAFEKGEEVILMIPSENPEIFKVKWEANGYTINDKIGTFNDYTITEVRIENGTYGMTR